MQPDPGPNFTRRRRAVGRSVLPALTITKDFQRDVLYRCVFFNNRTMRRPAVSQHINTSTFSKMVIKTPYSSRLRRRSYNNHFILLRKKLSLQSIDKVDILDFNKDKYYFPLAKQNKSIREIFSIFALCKTRNN